MTEADTAAVAEFRRATAEFARRTVAACDVLTKAQQIGVRLNAGADGNLYVIVSEEVPQQLRNQLVEKVREHQRYLAPVLAISLEPTR